MPCVPKKVFKSLVLLKSRSAKRVNANYIPLAVCAGKNLDVALTNRRGYKLFSSGIYQIRTHRQMRKVTKGHPLGLLFLFWFCMFVPRGALVIR